MIQNKYRKVSGDVTKLSENLFEGTDANLQMDIQQQRGLVNMAFFAKFKQEFTKSFADIISTFTGDDLAQDVDEILKYFKETCKVMASL